MRVVVGCDRKFIVENKEFPINFAAVSDYENFKTRKREECPRQKENPNFKLYDIFVPLTGSFAPSHQGKRALTETIQSDGQIVLIVICISQLSLFNWEAVISVFDSSQICSQ